VRVGALLVTCLCLAGCASRTDTAGLAGGTAGSTPRIAVFPVENLSGRKAPLDEVQQLLAGGLVRAGISVLDDAALESLVTKHRVRYTAGLEQKFAVALKNEANVDAIVIPSLEVYGEGNPPQVALFARLVTTGDTPTVLWADGVGAAGDDSPGILGLGLIEDPRELLGRTMRTVTASLLRHLAVANQVVAQAPTRFQPKIVYRSTALHPTQTYSVAVVPFFNKSARKYAGELVALQMMRNLLAHNLRIVEPGVVREELLRFRIIMTDGISLPDTETVLNAVNADLVLNGEVLEYYDSPLAAPVADFSVLFIERKTRRILYSSYSRNAGDDGVFFFDWRRINTAHAMTAHMTQAIGNRMLAVLPPAITPEPLRPSTEAASIRMEWE
jgi:hypothetical protein